MTFNRDMEYLEEKFPKGDKKRGFAMVLLALARMEGKPVPILDAENDILYSNWGNVKHSKELEKVDIILDFDKEHNVVGFEIFDFGERLCAAIERDNLIINYKDFLAEMKLNCQHQGIDLDIEDFVQKEILNE